MQKGGRVQAQLVPHIAERLGQKAHTFLVAVFGGVALEAVFNAFDIGQAADAGRHVRIRQFGLGRCKQPQAEEGAPGRCRQKVRVATPGVEHQPVGLARCHLDQFILELERAQMGQTLVVLRHGATPCSR